MKAKTCMLLTVICERYIGLCYIDDLKMKTIGASSILCVHIYPVTSPIYDDEYGRVHYDDDDHHASHDNQESFDFRTSLRTISLTMMAPGRVRTVWGSTLARVGRM